MPETMLPEIIADVEDAFRWVREQGPQLFAMPIRNGSASPAVRRVDISR
ncbi:MAG: hypothetical protein U0992_21325 [Planctomycetaceae bacterium]